MFDPVVLPTISQTHLERARTRFDDGDVLAVAGALTDPNARRPQAIAFDELGRSTLLVTHWWYGWCLGGESPEATRLLAAHMQERQIWSPYLYAKPELADVFVEEWLRQGGQTDGLAYRFNLMVFNPEKAPRPLSVEGHPERASHHDLPELAAHAVGFYRDALAETRTVKSQIERIRPLIEAGQIYLWRDDSRQIVSQAEHTFPLFNSVAIGCVYTPEQFRQKGYARALVGYLSKQLAEKKQRVTLFANSGVSHVTELYQSIGYETAARIHRYDALRMPS